MSYFKGEHKDVTWRAAVENDRVTISLATGVSKTYRVSDTSSASVKTLAEKFVELSLS